MSLKNNVDMRKAKALIREAAADGLEDGVDNIARLANDVTPIETGFLRNSQDTKVNRRTLRGEISYLADYAVYVHEIPPNSGGRGGSGNKHLPPTHYKFLERTAFENAADFVSEVGTAIRLHLK
jgi:hypothetical protein